MARWNVLETFDFAINTKFDGLCEILEKNSWDGSRRAKPVTKKSWDGSRRARDQRSKRLWVSL